jgi:hypothetical protein
VEPLFADAGDVKQFLGQTDFLFGLFITFQVMAITEMSPGHQNAVAPVFERFQHEQRIDPPRTHHTHGSDAGRILQPGNACQVSPGVSAPVTQKSNDSRFKISHYITLSFIGYRLWVIDNNMKLNSIFYNPSPITPYPILYI